MEYEPRKYKRRNVKGAVKEAEMLEKANKKETRNKNAQ